MRYAFAKLLVGLAAAGFANVGYTQPPSLLQDEPGGSIDIESFQSTMRHVMNNVVQVPGTNLVAADVNGQLIIILPNKRFAVVGKVFDLFERNELKTLDDIKEARRVDFVEMGMDFSELSTITIGTGPRDVVIFTDPLCPHCREIAKEADALGARYTTHFVLFPITTGESKPAAERILCGPNPTDAREALLSGRVDHLPPAEPGCADHLFVKTAMVAMTLSVQVVPYVFAPNGASHIGRPENLRAYLSINQ